MSNDGAAQAGGMPGAIHGIAELLRSDHGAGLAAELRRLDPDDPVLPALHRLAAAFLEGLLPEDGPARDEAERRWAVILASLASAPELHCAGLRMGRAMVMGGVSEARVVRLLRSHGRALLEAVRVVVHQLVQRSVGLDWCDVARLVLSDGGPSEDRIRRGIARDFYRDTRRASAPSQETT